MAIVKRKKMNKVAPKLAAKASKKTRAVKRVTENLKPLKNSMSKSEQMEWILETASDIAGHDIAKKDVKSVVEAINEMILSSVMPGSAGEIALFSLFKVVARKYPAKKMPAIKKGTLVRNPSTGDMVPSAGRAAFTKPATVKPKVRGLSRLRKAMNGD